MICPRFILQRYGDLDRTVRDAGTTFSDKMIKESFNSETPKPFYSIILNTNPSRSRKTAVTV